MGFDADVVIGLEIHVGLSTESKLFCGCAVDEGEPNSLTCPICLGMPGSKPKLNRKAVEYAIRLCLSLGCEVAPLMMFSRKTYFYPDMSKNYQITQYEVPLGSNGVLELSDGKVVGIERVHVEEDPASLVHAGSIRDSPFVLVDYNRSGHPLCEVVTRPEMHSPEEARDFMRQLINVLNYLGIFDPKRCIIKADANISIKESGYVRAEVKNISGFKDIERALGYEIARQRQAVAEDKVIIQETRGFDASSGTTFSMRTKETEDDYGYILDPDLVEYVVGEGWKKDIAASMPELPKEKRERYEKELGLSSDDAHVLASDYQLVLLFERLDIDPVLAARWIRREFVRVINYH
ncbi:Asp-tRNA(Asn)/Glu-tRNA(Gln) amidotransferase GatCAB subunit B, partial [Candidatus Woesearchaeota archaeon CG11_big_fil_rev_8_21_14_0_20_43_8]